MSECISNLPTVLMTSSVLTISVNNRIFTERQDDWKWISDSRRLVSPWKCYKLTEDDEKSAWFKKKSQTVLWRIWFEGRLEVVSPFAGAQPEGWTGLTCSTRRLQSLRKNIIFVVVVAFRYQTVKRILGKGNVCDFSWPVRTLSHAVPS